MPTTPPTEQKTEPKVEAKEVKTAPDFNPEALWDGRGIVPFKALDNPKMVTADKADFLTDEDYVLGIEVNGEARAYPTRFIWFHHVINDMVGTPAGGALPVAITYCSVCNSGALYDARLDGKPIKLDFYGLYNAVVALCERDTQTVMLQVNGRFVKGPLAGKQLPSKIVLDTTWGKWRKAHFDTLVMSPDTPYSKYYSPKERPEPRDYQQFPAPFFAPTLTTADGRLPMFDKVLGVAIPPRHAKPGDTDRAIRRAYPIKTLKAEGGVINDRVAKTSIVVLLEPDTVTANAFDRRVEGKTLTFQARALSDGTVAFYDTETGTRWSIEGKGQEGPMSGKSLTPVENHLSQWYGWYAYYPATTIYGRTDPPQPITPEKPMPPAPPTSATTENH